MIERHPRTKEMAKDLAISETDAARYLIQVLWPKAKKELKKNKVEIGGFLRNRFESLRVEKSLVKYLNSIGVKADIDQFDAVFVYKSDSTHEEILKALNSDGWVGFGHPHVTKGKVKLNLIKFSRGVSFNFHKDLSPSELRYLNKGFSV